MVGVRICPIVPQTRPAVVSGELQRGSTNTFGSIKT